MLTASQCQALALEYNCLACCLDVSQDRAAMLKNIARSLTGLATQLDRLAAHTRDKAAPQMACAARLPGGIIRSLP
jgi:hypothetical protein